jgi:hypothetical protein
MVRVVSSLIDSRSSIICKYRKTVNRLSKLAWRYHKYTFHANSQWFASFMTPSQFLARLSLEAPMLTGCTKKGLWCALAKSFLAWSLISAVRRPSNSAVRIPSTMPTVSITRPEITGLCQSLILTMYAQYIVATWECYLLQALRALSCTLFFKKILSALTHWNLEVCSHNFSVLTSFTINSFGSVFTQFSVLISFKVDIILEVCLHNFQFWQVSQLIILEVCSRNFSVLTSFRVNSFGSVLR